MKKIFSIITMMILCLGAFAQTESKIIYGEDSNDDKHYYYYNENNQLIWELYGTTRRVYTYTESGLVATMTQHSWVEADKAFTVNLTEAYKYDADGNMTENTQVKNPGSSFEVTWTYKYYDFVNGVATYYDEYKNGTLYYMYKQMPVFDDAKRLTSCVVNYADPDKYTNPTHETVEYKDKETEYSKTYDADGKLISEKKKSTEYNYTYAEMSADYAPKNLKATNDNGKVTLTWDAVAGAEKYIVSYDLNRVEVSSTSISAVVGTGNREFTVQAVIGGVERNAATPVTAEVSDKGKLPITDLTVGSITMTEEATESEELTTRTFYNIQLNWTLPEGHSEVVKYNIYYNSTAYGNDFFVSLTNPAATSYTLKIDPFEVTKWNEDNVPYEGIDTPIYVTVVYTTGESEKSNVVTVNPFAQFGTNAINSVTSDKNADTPYNAAGVKVTASAKGLIIKNGKKIFVK